MKKPENTHTVLCCSLKMLIWPSMSSIITFSFSTTVNKTSNIALSMGVVRGTPSSNPSESDHDKIASNA